MEIGLVLSGGGARGVAHIGVIQALEEYGVTFSRISGTSAGAIVGSLYAHGYTTKELFEIVREVSFLKTVRPAWTWAGLLRMDGFRQLLHKYLPENTFTSLKKPMVIAAAEIRRGEVEYFRDGELVPTIIASCSIPGLFPPYVLNGSYYVDGGILDNLPVRPIRDDCDFVVGSHCNSVSSAVDTSSMRIIIERSLLMAIGANTQASKKMCDMVVEPPGLDKYFIDLSKAKEIFDIGYRFTKENFNAKQFEKILT